MSRDLVRYVLRQRTLHSGRGHRTNQREHRVRHVQRTAEISHVLALWRCGLCFQRKAAAVLARTAQTQTWRCNIQASILKAARYQSVKQRCHYHGADQLGPARLPCVRTAVPDRYPGVRDTNVSIERRRGWFAIRFFRRLVSVLAGCVSRGPFCTSRFTNQRYSAWRLQWLRSVLRLSCDHFHYCSTIPAVLARGVGGAICRQHHTVSHFGRVVYGVRSAHAVVDLLGYRARFHSQSPFSSQRHHRQQVRAFARFALRRVFARYRCVGGGRRA